MRGDRAVGAADTQLPSSAQWFTFTWTIPSTPSVQDIGLQINNEVSGSTSSLSVAIAHLSWPSK